MQKRAIGIILGVRYVEIKKYYKFGNELHKYEIALEKTGLDPLSDRRESLTNKFALQFFNSERHKGLFQLENNNIQTRSNNMFQEERYNSERFRKSSIPYMTKLLIDIL